ncbi:MAG: prolipoprotein diacylglyceryl transferase [Flammeovirgaceae bacterium]|nr:prolipoprotein diacylglyceryl transferase [Flammeovirgaceae bacterium]
MSYSLNIIWSFDPILFSIFGFQISWLAFLSLVGFSLGFMFLNYSYKKEKRSTRELEVLSLYMIIFGFLGARIGYFINEQSEEFLQGLQNLVNFNLGEFSTQGGVIGILLGLIIFSYGKRNFWQVIDKVAVSALIIAFFINIGYFLSSEEFGSPTKGQLGIAFTQQTGSLLHEVLDKVSTSIILADTVQGDGSQFIPIKYKITFIEEFKSQSEIETYLNTEIKQFLANQSNLYEPQQSFLNFKIYDQKENNKITAEIHSFIIKNHPTQLYTAVFYLVLFLLFFNRYFKFSKGKATSVILVSLFIFNSFTDYFFGANENISFFASLTNNSQWLNFSLVLIALILFIKSQNKPSRISYY